ncbi:MAG: serine/threonine-protein kinase [Pseudomonadota bacterium]|nr:serine/threonine-protein kinase [Pseudomonadota bacterium]
MSATLSPGTLLEHRYEVLEVLGSGTFAQVYKVRHVGLLSLHALKVLDATLAADAEIRGRFLAEGRIQAGLRHPNVVTVTDIVTSPCAGLVMEYAEGPSLDMLAAGRGPLPLDEIQAIVLPVLDAVGCAHAAGVVHRDLKPENILIARTPRGEPRPMVADFGIAKVLSGPNARATAARTRVGSLLGTPEYMSPEQVRAQEVDARSDLFSLGAILYELATGARAFTGDSDFELMQRIVQGTYTPPLHAFPAMVPGLAACIARALQVDPAARFQTAEAFGAELRRAGVVPKPGLVDGAPIRVAPKPPCDPDETPLQRALATLRATIAHKQLKNGWCQGEIPPNKLASALRAYGGGVTPDKVLLLVDDTFWGGAGNGFFLTAEAIHWCNLAGNAERESYASIRGTNCRAGNCGLDLYRLGADGQVARRIDITTGRAGAWTIALFNFLESVRLHR